MLIVTHTLTQLQKAPRSAPETTLTLSPAPSSTPCSPPPHLTTSVHSHSALHYSTHPASGLRLAPPCLISPILATEVTAEPAFVRSPAAELPSLLFTSSSRCGIPGTQGTSSRTSHHIASHCSSSSRLVRTQAAIMGLTQPWPHTQQELRCVAPLITSVQLASLAKLLQTLC